MKVLSRAGLLVLLVASSSWLSANAGQSAPELAIRGWEALQAGQLQEGKNLLVRAVRLGPSQPAYRVMLAEVAWRLQNFNESVRQLERAIKLNPTDYAVRLTLVQHYQSLNKDLDALRILAVPEP